MKNSLVINTILVLLVMTFSACQKDYDERYQLKAQFIEFEDAVSATVAVGKNYPILTRTLSKTSGVVELQVNMTGEQFASDQQFTWRIVSEESTAVEGRDFQITSPTIQLKANTSITSLTLEALPTTGEGSTVVVLELVGNDQIKPMEKYKRVGVRCVY